jgi:putative salt-induced outer membrane protein YdiY
MILQKSLKNRSLAWLVAMLVTVFAQAESGVTAKDEILLKNGSRILGEVTGSRDGVVTIETDFAGTIDVELEQIKSVNTQDPVVILMADESVQHDSTLVIAEEQLVLSEPGQTFPLDDLLVVNPDPWELGVGYRWTGTLGFALVRERGNTDSDELDYKLESEWRSKWDRYTVQANGEKDENNGTKTADKWKFGGKYDYFLEDPNYIGLVALAEKDKFQDLDLRYLIGPYLGRQFYDEPIFSLRGELGFSYVSEEFNVSEDDEYGASIWNIHLTSDYLGGDSSLYFDQFGVWNLKETSDVIVKSTFGLSYPLLWKIEAAVEVLLEYDSGAVVGVDDLDQTYKFRLGYTW